MTNEEQLPEQRPKLDTKRGRRWKYDRMLAMKMVCPQAYSILLATGWDAHMVDVAICEFFWMPVAKDSYTSLRAVARRLLKGDADKIRQHMSMMFDPSPFMSAADVLRRYIDTEAP